MQRECRIRGTPDALPDLERPSQILTSGSCGLLGRLAVSGALRRRRPGNKQITDRNVQCPEALLEHRSSSRKAVESPTCGRTRLLEEQVGELPEVVGHSGPARR